MDEMELIFGKERIRKEKELKEALEKIEKKYINFFKSRPPKSEYDGHDRLHNHWMLTHVEGRWSFRIDPDAGLPEMIMEECTAEFNRIFFPPNNE